MKKCPECDSEKIVRDVYIAGDSRIQAVVDERPDALILKQPVRTEIRAEVCADCGFIQAYVEDAKRLWFAYQSSTLDVE